MRNLILIGLLAFASCKKSDNGSSVPEGIKPFIGTWIGYTNFSSLRRDTLVFEENQTFSTTLYSGAQTYEILSADSIRFKFKNQFNMGFETFGYNLEKEELVIICWGLGTSGSCFNYTFTKQ